MTVLHSIALLVEILVLAVCLTGIVEGIHEDAEKRRLIRRERYRRKAYAEIYRRRCQNDNRAELWNNIQK